MAFTGAYLHALPRRTKAVHLRRTPIEAANERAYLVGRDDHPFGAAGQTGFLFVSQASRNA